MRLLLFLRGRNCIISPSSLNRIIVVRFTVRCGAWVEFQRGGEEIMTDSTELRSQSPFFGALSHSSRGDDFQCVMRYVLPPLSVQVSNCY